MRASILFTSARNIAGLALSFLLSLISCGHGQVTYDWALLAGSGGGGNDRDGLGSDGGFNQPYDVATDASGNIYVADYANQLIRKVTSEGLVTTLAGKSGVIGTADGAADVALFTFPTGIAVDHNGTIYVAEGIGKTIRKLTSAGVVTTLAGIAGSSGSADGVGSAARFGFPADLAVDGSGNVYVADSTNHTVRKVTSTGVVTTFAGLAGVSGSTDGTATDARFNHPVGVAVDAVGNLYVVDGSNRTIRKVTPVGEVSTLAGTAGTMGNAEGAGAAARFTTPHGVAVDGTGNLYVTDSYNINIYRVTGAGVVTRLVDPAAIHDSYGSDAGLNVPQLRGVAVDASGDIYVGDAGNHTVLRITSEGVVAPFAGGPPRRGSVDANGRAARFSSPLGVAVDKQGNAYVADGGRLRQVTRAGTVSTFETDVPLSSVSGVALDENGDLYITTGSTVRKVTSDGKVTTLAGQEGSTGSADGSGSNARFATRPGGLALDKAGNIYVADAGNHSIRKVTSSGVVTTFAGDHLFPGNTDGIGSSARFRSPSAIAVDADGNIYVADTNNDALRKITSTGVVTTIEGAFYSPSGVSVDARGNVYVAENSVSRIRRVSKSGVVITVANVRNPGETWINLSDTLLLRPTAIAIGPNEELYIANGGTFNVVVGTIVPDAMPPVFTIPGPITAEATSAAGAAVSYLLEVTDEEDPAPLVETDRASGSIFPLGTTTVNVLARDEAGNETQGAFTVTVQDSTAPNASVPEILELVAGPKGQAFLGDLTGNVTRTDTVSVPTVTQSPGSDTVLGLGNHQVAFTALDAQGNATTIHTTVRVAFADSAEPEVTQGPIAGPVMKGLAMGALVPGAGAGGLPADAKFGAFFAPAISDTRQVAARATLLSGRKTLAGIYVEDGAGAGGITAFQGGLALDADGVPLTGVTFKSFLDPISAPNGAIAYAGKLQGGDTKMDFGVWSDLFSSDKRLLLREGSAVPGLGGARLKAVSSLSLADGQLLALLMLAPPSGSINAANDTVLLRLTGPNIGTALLREGHPLTGFSETLIKSFTVLSPALGSPGHGRWHSPEAVLAKVTLASEDVWLVSIGADGAITRLLSTAEPATPLSAGTHWKSFGLPVMSSVGPPFAVAATLQPAPGIATARDDSLLLTSPDGSSWNVLARENELTPISAELDAPRYASFFDPVVNADGCFAFLATLQGSSVKASSKTALFSGKPDQLHVSARLGDPVPDETGVPTTAVWSRFITHSLPRGTGVVLLAETKGGDTSSTNGLALWAADATGRTRRILRTGSIFGAGGPHLTGIDLLGAPAAAYGTTRSFNATKSLAVRATFSDKTETLLRIDLP